MNWLNRRLKEPSTWASIIGALAYIAGYSLGDDQVAKLAGGAAVLVGLFLAKESGDPTTRPVQLPSPAPAVRDDTIVRKPVVQDKPIDNSVEEDRRLSERKARDPFPPMGNG